MTKTAQDLAVQLLVQAVRTAVEKVRYVQLDSAQCDPNADFRRGWTAACERLLAELNEEE